MRNLQLNRMFPIHVHYYEEGTTNKVADDKIVNNQTFDATVEENAKDIQDIL